MMPNPPAPQPNPAQPASVRADIWLWAVRLFKTRALAAAACRGGKVHRDQSALKPASPLRPGDRLSVTVNEVKRLVQVDQLIARRVGAPQAATCFTDHTPASVLEAAREARLHAHAARPAGDGRPTKQDRRQYEKLRDALRGMGYGDGNTGDSAS